MHLDLRLSLPREKRSVPVCRRVVTTALDTLGVEPGCAHEIAIVLSEACTNVLQHADRSDTYDVGVHLDDRQCTLRVTDLGRGLDEQDVPTEVTTEAEHGRGLLLMRMLVDDLRFEPSAEEGTAVRLTKRLEYEDPTHPPGQASVLPL